MALAAVIGMPHEKWGERPRLVVELCEGQAVTPQELLAHLSRHLARWWVPDDVVFVPALPLGATGKIDKKAVRSMPAGQSATVAA